MNAFRQQRAWYWIAIAAIVIALVALLVPHGQARTPPHGWRFYRRSLWVCWCPSACCRCCRFSRWATRPKFHRWLPRSSALRLSDSLRFFNRSRDTRLVSRRPCDPPMTNFCPSAERHLYGIHLQCTRCTCHELAVSGDSADPGLLLLVLRAMAAKGKDSKTPARIFHRGTWNRGSRLDSPLPAAPSVRHRSAAAPGRRCGRGR